MTKLEYDAVRAPAVHAARLQRAHQYAAQVRERNKAPCQCDACRTAEALPMVQRLTERWASCGA